MSRPENDAVLQNERLGTLKKIFSNPSALPNLTQQNVHSLETSELGKSIYLIIKDNLSGSYLL